MIGSLLIYKPDLALPYVQQLEAPPTAEKLARIVGGYIELVPHFNTIMHRGTKRKCAAFCNEHGKLDCLPRNDVATKLWNTALERSGIMRNPDHLVGPVVIVIGDNELMRQL